MKDWRPKLTAINDPIADDYWSYRTEDGAERISRVTIGRPALLADGTNWYCPMYFEHVTRGIDYAMGVGPVDALMNAMYFVRRRFYEFDDVTPQAKPTTASKRPRAKKSQPSSPKPRKIARARRTFK
ncbi:hypothetical protein [Stigmatella hybrida]|uniref:hypothetical protein n=1 Tax=Stigmatella hybrida TaxID=394097 RepID=UPI001CDB1BDF|nr:hypothetical protein [Stigmatella hybrida]